MAIRKLALSGTLATLALNAAPGFAQPADGDGMDHSHLAHGAAMPGSPAIYLEGSGTSRLPGAEPPMGGLHFSSGSWQLMAHGFLTAQYTDVSGPRGDEKLYSTSMVMVAAQRRTAWGRIQLKSMASLEPGMSDRGYPSLFSTGETAGGMALVDRQHPHDLFMELAARIDVDIGRNSSVFLYGGPVGEPALGPSAFLHRGSAAHNPDPPIAHHWFDSTHITYGVLTAGFSGTKWQLETSLFRGQEPDEARWDIETPRLDSWSIRATLSPSPSWTMQAGFGELNEPETLHPGQHEQRLAASVHYASGSFNAMAAFSAKDRSPGASLNAWIGEINWDITPLDSLFGRIENVANDELFSDHDDPLHARAFRVTRMQLGYARHIALGNQVQLTLGASGSAYAKPGALDAAYGSDPFGYTLFARISMGH